MEQLEAQCEPVPCMHSVSIAAYYKSANDLLRMGDSFAAAGDLARAYVFLKRFCHLVIVTIPAHNAFASKQFAPERAQCKRQCMQAMDRLELIRPILVDMFAAADADAAAAAAAEAEEPNDSLDSRGGPSSAISPPPPARTDSRVMDSLGGSGGGALASSSSGVASRPAAAAHTYSYFAGMLPIPQVHVSSSLAHAHCGCSATDGDSDGNAGGSSRGSGASASASSAGYPVVASRSTAPALAASSSSSHSAAAVAPASSKVATPFSFGAALPPAHVLAQHQRAPAPMAPPPPPPPPAISSSMLPPLPAKTQPTQNTRAVPIPHTPFIVCATLALCVCITRTHRFCR
jgi:hypothetical protein